MREHFRVPPFTKNAKDGAPTPLVMPAKSKTWATRQLAREQYGDSAAVSLGIVAADVPAQEALGSLSFLLKVKEAQIVRVSCGEVSAIRRKR
jgi:hypothetical protein